MMFGFLIFCLVGTLCAADPQWYTIFPAKMDDGPDNDNISQDLLSTIGSKSFHHSHSTALKGHLYWYAYLDDAQKTKYDTFKGV